MGRQKWQANPSIVAPFPAAMGELVQARRRTNPVFNQPNAHPSALSYSTAFQDDATKFRSRQARGSRRGLSPSELLPPARECYQHHRERQIEKAGQRSE